MTARPGLIGRLLTLDLGNSRLKLCVWRATPAGAREVEERAELAAGENLAGQLERWLAAREHFGLAVLSSVGTPSSAEVVEALAAARTEVLASAPDPGLEVRCDEPEAVGRDRLYAARGALEALGRSAVVVDVGTALTCDALRLERAGARGVFLGGSIAPGPALLSDSLSTGTARLPRVSPVPGPPALGRDTAGAIRAGVGVGIRGAARELVEAVAREADLGAAPVALSGGARDYLLAPDPFTERELLIDADLVHRGLLAAGLGGGA